MSVTFSYVLEPATSNEREFELHGKVRRDMELRYRLFKGTVGIVVDQTDLSVKHQIPVLDFVAALVFALRSVRSLRSYEFEFTVGEGNIRFELSNDDEISVSASYSEETATCRYDEFASSLHYLAVELVTDLESRSPNMALSQSFKEIAADILLPI